MRIAQLSSNVERVPPAGYGGTELVVSNLTEELIRRGHDVTLFGTGDSLTRGELVSVIEMPLRASHEPVRRWQAYDTRLLLELKARIAEFDVIHNHMGWQALPLLDDLHVPMVTTNHNIIKSYCAPIYLRYGNLPFVSISHAYRRLNYPDRLNYVATIYNGIDVDEFSSNGNGNGQRQFLLFIGRLSQDKGTAPAIEIAKRLHLPIVLAGKVDDNDKEYFDALVRPYINSSDVQYIGEVNQHEKIKLYQQAIATVYPIDFEEPFGLVMAESLAAGTPVMAFDRGSVREVLSDGETAVIGNSVDELVARFPQIQKISSAQCRQRVRKLFTINKMVDAYESVYKQLVS